MNELKPYGNPIIFNKNQVNDKSIYKPRIKKGVVIVAAPNKKTIELFEGYMNKQDRIIYKKIQQANAPERA